MVIIWRAFAILSVAVLLAAAPQGARAQVAIDPLGADVIHAGEFVVPVNKSQVLRVDQPFTELLIGNPEIADVVALTNQTVYVLGKQLGTTNLTIYGPRRQLLAVLDLVVSYDVESLKAKLHEVLPGETIEVRTVNGGVLLGGKVSNATALSDALAIAGQYAPDSVTNAMTVEGSQQVMLQVKFAEVSRNVVRQLGIGHDLAVTGDLAFGGFPALPQAGEAEGGAAIHRQPMRLRRLARAVPFVIGGGRHHAAAMPEGVAEERLGCDLLGRRVEGLVPDLRRIPPERPEPPAHRHHFAHAVAHADYGIDGRRRKIEARLHPVSTRNAEELPDGFGRQGKGVAAAHRPLLLQRYRNVTCAFIRGSYTADQNPAQGSVKES